MAATPDNQRPVKHNALTIQAGTEALLAQKCYGTGLEHAGANSLQYIGTATPLEDDIVDSCTDENVGQQHAGRTAADDDDLCSSLVVCH
jgi:hypothetical protein